MGEELADFMGLSTMTREFMDTDEGLAVMRANQENVRANDPDLYTAFLDSILSWGRRLPGQENEPLWTEKIRSVSPVRRLVLTGDNDYFIPAKFSKIIAEAIPGAAYAEIPGGGHIPVHRKAGRNGEGRRRLPRRELSGSALQRCQTCLGRRPPPAPPASGRGEGKDE